MVPREALPTRIVKNENLLEFWLEQTEFLQFSERKRLKNTHKIECFQPWNRSAYKRFSETLVPRLSPYIRGL